MPPTALTPTTTPADHDTLPVSISRQADSDEQLIALWLHGRASATVRAYRAYADQFRSFVSHPLQTVKVRHVQHFADHLAAQDLAPSSQALALSAIKSLFSFAHRLGYLPFNVAAVVSAPKLKDRRAERILAEGDVSRMIALEPSRRNRTLCRVLYGAGLRVAEAARLSWTDCRARDDGSGQLAVHGKGGKTRYVWIPASLWGDLKKLRNGADDDEPVFRSRQGGPLDASSVWRIVRRAAQRAGITADVSPHWLRHGHASHALDRGAPVHLVQATLGHASVATTGRYLHARPKDSSARYVAV